MLEESIDPRPPPDQFARWLAARAAEGAQRNRAESWLRGWHDQEGAWANVRNFEHWIERSRR